MLCSSQSLPQYLPLSWAPPGAQSASFLPVYVICGSEGCQGCDRPRSIPMTPIYKKKGLPVSFMRSQENRREMATKISKMTALESFSLVLSMGVFR